MKVIIDRFEGGFAVVELEDGRFVNVDRKLIPAGAKEGDVLLMTEGDAPVFTPDPEETRKRSRKIGKMMDELFED